MNERLIKVSGVLCIAFSLAVWSCGSEEPSAREKMPLVAEEAAQEKLPVPGLQERKKEKKQATMPAGLRRAFIAARMKEAGPEYAFSRRDGLLRADGAGKKLVFSADAGGVIISPRSGRWRAVLALSGVGRDGRVAPAGAVEPRAEGNRVVFERRHVVEEYLNGPPGLEQVIRLERRPAGEGFLALRVKVGGGLVPEIDSTPGRLLLQKDGRPLLVYSDLYVHDATGRRLDAWMGVERAEIVLHVDDEGAQYPVTVDPLLWAFQQKLVAVGGAAFDNFGHSVAVHSDTAVVGAPNESVGSNTSQGAAYVFLRTAGIWELQAKLTASDGAAGDSFGASVAIYGDTVVVGARYDDIGSNTRQGSAYVFVRSGSTWTEQTKLTASDGAAHDQFGYSVAIYGDTVVVGARTGDIGSNTDQGSAYVFVRSGTTWTQQQKLFAIDGAAGDYFGHSVDIYGDTVVVGAKNDDIGSNADQGSVYIFVRSGTAWSQQAKLTASDGATEDYFGVSVAIERDTVVVGAYGDAIGSDEYHGSAYVFVRSGTTWTEQAKLTASDGAAYDFFGRTVSIYGDTVVVGAYGDDIGSNNEQGSAYVFVRSGTAWTEQAKLTASDGAAGDSFGWAVAIYGDTVVVGAFLADIGSNEDQGSAYVLVRSGAAWVQQQKLITSDGEAGDVLGSSVAIYGDTIVVGAEFDDIGSNTGQGSAYVFVRSGTTWSQQAKLIASDGASSDFFGYSVAIHGDTVVVGAPGKDIGRSIDQGSAYVFVRSGTTWSQQAELTAGGGHYESEFGCSVAIHGDTVVVGAHRDNIGSNYEQGSAYVFVRSGGTWTEQAKLTASDGSREDKFGNSVAIYGDTVVVGAKFDDVGSNTDQGSAYVFVRIGTSWSQQAKLSANDGAAIDYFGHSVSIYGNTVAVGARGSYTTAGSAYVFVRSGTTWTQQAKLTASDGAEDDSFGISVGIYRDTVVVGANWDDIGSNSSQGSAYVFVRSGTWTQWQKITAGDGEAGEQFGISVATYGDTVVVGAPGDTIGQNVGQGSAYVFISRFELGDPCTSDDECHSGYCVDGVCCDGPCGGGSTTDCMACSALFGAAANGTCGPLTASFAPTVTCRPSAGDCDLPETCEPTSTSCPADTYRHSSHECRAAAGVCDAVEYCTGTGPDCPADAKLTTECRPAAGVCDVAEVCDGVNDDCPPDTFQPSTYECRPAAGACDMAEYCTGDSATCPEDSFQPSDFVCRPATCTDGVAVEAAYCSGTSAECPDSPTRNCVPYACGQDACLDTCSTSDDCSPGYDCVGGVCRVPGNPGDPCLSANECRSGFCADGVCCDTACTGQCEACDVEGNVGTCTAVVGEPHGGREPCASDGSACGGSCDGVNRTACAYPGPDVQCREASCTDSVAVLPAFCQGNGSCPAEQTQQCPDGCDGDTCASAECEGDGDCEADEFCSAGVCTPKFSDGESCAGDNQCQSGHCTDGYCCDSACDGQCEACDVEGNHGVCTAVTGSPHGGRPGCGGIGDCAGTCDGTNRTECVFPGSETECAEPSCTDGMATAAGTCDGEGNCDVPEAQECKPYTCGEDACLTSCEDSSQCVGGYVCVSGRCEEATAASAGGGCGCGTNSPGGALAFGLLVLVLFLRRRMFTA